MGFIPFTVACAVASVFVCKFADPVIALILVILGFIPLLLEFLMYKQFIDPLFKGHPSHNLVATRKASGETKSASLSSVTPTASMNGLLTIFSAASV